MKTIVKNGMGKQVFCTCFLYLKHKGILFTLAILLLVSCEDFVDIDAPRNEIVRETAFTDDESAISAISGIYSKMMNDVSFTKGRTGRYLGLYSDELQTFSNDFSDIQFLNSALQAENGIVLGVFWSDAYNYILNANTLLEGLETSTDVTRETSDQLIGEAKFIRAFCHFHLVNLFGPIPLVTTTDVNVNNTLERSSEQEVYEQIVQDLIEAKELLSSNFDFVGGERIRPNKDAATALLARTYLYLEEWGLAEQEATEILTNDLYRLEPNLNDVFKATSMEAIWQLKPVDPPNYVAPQASLFVLTSAPPLGNQVFLKEDFINRFEVGDNRLDQWISSVSDTDNTYFFPYKYKNVFNPTLEEYTVVFRLAEQYLIRAEARANQNKLAGARSDLNRVRTRAGLASTAVTLQDEVVEAIAEERLKELFTEWGHRWFDIKRTGRADEVLGPIKPQWQATNILFPIPQGEINNNANLLPQNPGY